VKVRNGESVQVEVTDAGGRWASADDDADRLRREHPAWAVLWIGRAREYRGYRNNTTLTAETPDDLAAQISQAEQPRS
jgi:hypothetical protein